MLWAVAVVKSEPKILVSRVRQIAASGDFEVDDRYWPVFYSWSGRPLPSGCRLAVRSARQVWLVAIATTGCAVGVAVGEDDTQTEGVASLVPDGVTEGTDTVGHERCPDDCTLAEGLCFEPAGWCIEGRCEFALKSAGAACGDPSCPGSCDGLGECLGAVCTCNDDDECAADHASGRCADGACVIECDADWGDCNDDATDGCETRLDTLDDCGACGEVCHAGEHASTECSAGACQRTCEPPWENCDDDWSNGCEIPTGVPSQCSVMGLDAMLGCGTAWCGQSTATKATNFGSWYCLRCVSCQAPASGMCQWCDHFEDVGSGEWFSPDGCSCGADEDNVCAP